MTVSPIVIVNVVADLVRFPKQKLCRNAVYLFYGLDEFVDFRFGIQLIETKPTIGNMSMRTIV